MKEITLNNRTFLFVEVPDGATDFSVGFSIMCWGKDGIGDFIQLPFTEKIYHFIATTTDITEEQAGEIVDSKSAATGGGDYECLYRKYTGSQDECDFPWFSEMNKGALKSFASLLESHSITGRHAIIEKI